MSAPVHERFAQLPASLRDQSLLTTLAGVPALLAHPDPGWSDGPTPPTPRPIMLWMHGRTVNKELDPGRYLRWIRSGIAACALDLPGHGERFDESLHSASRVFEVVERMAGEIDGVIAALGEPRLRSAFDTTRIGIGGMSAGGMATLIRLSRPHSFACAAVESTAGDFSKMSRFVPFYTSGGRDPGGATAQRLNPMMRLSDWRPIPFLALHSEADEWVPIEAMRSFCEALRARHAQAGAAAELVTLKTWPITGAPNEHAGFGKVGAEAKDIQVEFLKKHLLP